MKSRKEAAERQQEVDGVDGLSTWVFPVAGWVEVVCIQAARSLGRAETLGGRSPPAFSDFHAERSRS